MPQRNAIDPAGHPGGRDRVLPSVDAARTYAAEQALCPGPIGRVGLELEGHLVDRDHLARRIPWDEVTRVRELVPPLPHGSLLSVEPGGQLELSTLPAADVAGAVAALLADRQVLADTLRTQGYGIAYLGLDPVRPPERVNPAERYALMERYFDGCGCGVAARRLMSASAGLQLNLEAGPPGGWPDRLRRIYRLGPVLTAISACSTQAADPGPGSGLATGSASMRQQAWFALEPARTVPVPFGGEPGLAWADYALRAPLMLLRAPDGALVEAPPGLTFGAWAAGSERVDRPPTVADLDYHLTTLFPVIRPRGFLELRFLDAAPTRFWPGLAAIVATLIDDPVAADRAADAVGDRPAEPALDWPAAARDGLRTPEFRRLAARCAAIAVEHCPDDLRDRAADYAALVDSGRTPGDLLRDEADGDGWRLLEKALE